MRQILTVYVAVFFGFAPAAGLCGEHLASSQAVTARLAQSQQQRAADLAAIDAALSTDPARRAADSLGVQIDSVKSAAATLSDRELRDLATRAGLVGADPSAGYYGDDAVVHDFLIIFLLVAIVAIMLSAVH
jgi:hypothetical protein